LHLLDAKEGNMEDIIKDDFSKDGCGYSWLNIEKDFLLAEISNLSSKVSPTRHILVNRLRNSSTCKLWNFQRKISKKRKLSR
jgi:hypothetical protein